jgi:hypothetical protein
MEKYLVLNFVSTILLFIGISCTIFHKKLHRIFLNIRDYFIIDSDGDFMIPKTFIEKMLFNIHFEIVLLIVSPVCFITSLVLGILSRNNLWGKIVIGISCFGCLICLLVLIYLILYGISWKHYMG